MSHPGNVLRQNEEIFHIAGDVPDPTGQSNIRGVQSTTLLDKSKIEVTVRYRDFLMTCDLYQLAGTPDRLILICPRCKNVLTISGDKKHLEYQASELQQFGGKLNVEAFQCTWEADPNGRRMEFGLGLCGWRVGIDNNVAKDA